MQSMIKTDRSSRPWQTHLQMCLYVKGNKAVETTAFAFVLDGSAFAGLICGELPGRAGRYGHVESSSSVDWASKASLPIQQPRSSITRDEAWQHAVGLEEEGSTRRTWIWRASSTALNWDFDFKLRTGLAGWGGVGGWRRIAMAGLFRGWRSKFRDRETSHGVIPPLRPWACHPSFWLHQIYVWMHLASVKHCRPSTYSTLPSQFCQWCD